MVGCPHAVRSLRARCTTNERSTVMSSNQSSKVLVKYQSFSTIGWKKPRAPHTVLIYHCPRQVYKCNGQKYTKKEM
ncbi:hypothetical protein SETIT_7G008500v2 [Setaria italica]|uniref:Uncharacterized protein n=1 Tax=Setaria italica TaxID=4555 RepID=A0A368RQJ4_SETIT|nr:hypothetical protein SETIT_7G008500v2 [Setaria italica]